MILDKITIDLRSKFDAETDKQLFPDVITFYAYPELEKDWVDRMNARITLTDKERKETVHDYHVDLLTALIAKSPKGLPDFSPGETWKEDFTAYLRQKNEAKEILAKAMADGHYNQVRNYSFRS
jgi:hypothetical protein